MKFGVPPWLKRAKDTVTALVPYRPPEAPTEAEAANGWDAEALAAYQAERDARAMATVAASMEGRLRPRPKWANSKYDPLRWRG